MNSKPWHAARGDPQELGSGARLGGRHDRRPGGFSGAGPTSRELEVTLIETKIRIGLPAVSEGARSDGVEEAGKDQKKLTGQENVAKRKQHKPSLFLGGGCDTSFWHLCEARLGFGLFGLFVWR